LRSLRSAGLTRIVYSPSNRVPKHRHVLDVALGLDDAGLAVLAVLLLRGAQTVGELKARTDRLHRFADLAEVEDTLRRLAEAPSPVVVRLGRRPGQKDLRWEHRLGAAEASSATTAPVTTTTTAREAAVVALDGDERIAALEEAVTAIAAEVAALRRRVDDIAGPEAAEI